MTARPGEAGTPASRPRNGLAVAALATPFAMFGLTAPLGAVLGVAALVQISRAARAGVRQRGTGQAVAGIVVGVLVTALWAAAVWFVVWAVQLSDRSDRFADPAQVTEPAEIYFTSLNPGHCANFGHFGAGRVTVVPCDQPHNWELLTMVPVQSGPDGVYPGSGSSFQEGTAACTKYFDTLPDSALSYLRPVPLVPPEDLWDEGYTETWCFAESKYGKVTGSSGDDTVAPAH
ncbi:DUF4190 domain-containing protein [Sanguibacter gelidistatuariae]|nr:DUF4190 domain-containing protein [Sanguibacter gelidistatuariae]